MGLRRLPAQVWWIAGGVVVVLLALARRYGWHRDELYFLEAGRHLAWGYIDQPPFTPFVARVADEIARHDLLVLRLVPALATGASVVLGALLVRELGGGRTAQILGAGVVAGSGFVLGAGHLLATATFDITAWLTALLVTVRLLRTGDPRWWVAFGAVTGAALLNKHLIVMLAVAVVAGMVVDRRWELVASPWAGAGAALALAVASPNLVWQATNGWPQLEMAEVLSERLAAENRATLVPLQLLFFGPLVLPLLWWGARWLGRDPAARPFRPLVWAWPVALALVFASGGRPYYLFPLTLVVGLAGLVARDREPAGMRPLVLLVPANALLSLPLALPVLPESTATPIASVNEAVAETIGWPDFVAQVATAVDGLPAHERDDVVLLAASYGEAGAIDRFGPEHGLPHAYSGHNSYAGFRRPHDDAATVVAIRYPTARLESFFERCELVDRIETPHDVPAEIRGTPIHVCHRPVGGWEAVWPRLHHLS